MATLSMPRYNTSASLSQSVKEIQKNQKKFQQVCRGKFRDQKYVKKFYCKIV